MFEQDRFLVRLQQKVLGELLISACFMAGSYGRKQQDSYSDMDVAFVFKSEMRRDDAWRKRREFVRSITPYVPAKSFDADHIRPYFHIALYANGTKVDFRYEVQDQLAPNPWDRDLRILKDDNGWVEQYQAQCAQTAQPIPRLDGNDLVALDQRFWIMFWDVFRLVLRGDSDKPFPIYLELLHFTLPHLINVLPQGTQEREQLLVANFSNNNKLTKKHLHHLLTAYTNARNRIVQQQHLDVKFDSKFETAVLALVKRHS